jgi:hypothetical protein
LALAALGAHALAQQSPAASSTPAPGAHFPWTRTDTPPSVAGLHLGDARAAVEARLGKAAESRLAGAGLALEYPEQGLSILLDAGGGVSMIYLLTRLAGSIDGVRVGDDPTEVRARWGEPPLVQGAQAMYPSGDWAVVVELGAEQRVVSISLGRSYGNTDLQ